MKTACTLVLIPLLVMACTRPEAPSDDDAPAPRESVTETASPIQARVGEEFTIVLRANATTGYSWALADSLDPALVALVRDEYVPDPAPPGMAGSGGRERWVFRALARGETTISMRYARSWEQGAPAAETADFRVVIR